jgi:sn-glycerol 3-phosphate transport system substrate-binding protein
VLYYNQQAFTKAGIAKAPTTIDEMTADAHKLTQAGYSDGMSLKNDPWWMELWSSMGKAYYVNNQNGRAGRATATAFDTDRNRSLLTKLQNMVKASDAKSYSATGAGLAAFANLFAMQADKSGMTIDTSAALGTIAQYLPLAKNITIGVAPIPMLTTGDNGGLEVGGNAFSISSKNSALENAAAFDFLKFMSSAQNMASWDVSTGYVPLTTDAAKQKAITNLWKTKPYYKVAYDQIQTGGASNATAGPAIGNYYAVNTQVANSLNQILTITSTDVATALANARQNADNAIASYNSSL